jgi:hypothetical protein
MVSPAPHRGDHDSPESGRADLDFHFDPICPFAWITSRWIIKVAAQSDYRVDWRFISLRLINADKDYATDFPPGYEQGHTAGLRILRVAAAVRDARGTDAVGEFYTAAGRSIFERDPDPDWLSGGDRDRAWMGTPDHLVELLAAAGLPTELADAAEDTAHDIVIGRESDQALERTGRDVGTPIIIFHPPDGPAFFGPVISRVPDDDEAVELWNAVIALATFPGFAELKRSLREMPQLRVFGA